MATAEMAPKQMQPGTPELMISADSHVIEDPDLWVNGVPAKFKDAAPKYPPRKVVSMEERSKTVGTGGFQAHDGGFDPKKRIAEMAVDGVSAEVIFPSLALEQFSIKDPALQEACFHAYNDWIRDYCAVAPDRLLGLACLSVYDIDNAVRELERSLKMGLKGGLVWQVPPEQYAFHTDHYDKLWAAAQEMDVPINMHILSGEPFFPERARAKNMVETGRVTVNLKVNYAANSLSDIIHSGVYERFPRLKLVIVETDVSWMPFYLTQWDKYYARKTPATFSTSTKKPSDVFAEKMYACVFDDPPVGWGLFEHWGQNNIMWSNDFPHANSTWPNSRQVIQRDMGQLTPEIRAKLISGNCMKLYNMPPLRPLSDAEIAKARG